MERLEARVRVDDGPKLLPGRQPEQPDGKGPVSIVRCPQECFFWGGVVRVGVRGVPVDEGVEAHAAREGRVRLKVSGPCGGLFLAGPWTPQVGVVTERLQSRRRLGIGVDVRERPGVVKPAPAVIGASLMRCKHGAACCTIGVAVVAHGILKGASAAMFLDLSIFGRMPCLLRTKH